MIKLKNLRSDATNYYLFVDLAMVALVLINLSWIIFDWMFTVPWVQTLLGWVSASFVSFYAEQIHVNFYNYDLIFVSLFIVARRLFCAKLLFTLSRYFSGFYRLI